MATDTAAMTPDKSTTMTADQSSSQQSRSSAQQRVFDLPELFEIILRNLKPLDIIRASGVNKIGRGLLGSPLLQRTMGIKREPGGSFWIPLFGRCEEGYLRNHYAGGTCSVFIHHGTYGGESIDVHFGRISRTTWSPAQLLRPGTLSHSILLSDPPAMQAELRLYCLHERRGGAVISDGGTPMRKLVSEMGLTIGDISDAAALMTEEHQAQQDSARTSCCAKAVLPGFILTFDTGLSEGEYRNKMLLGKDQ